MDSDDEEMVDSPEPKVKSRRRHRKKKNSYNLYGCKIGSIVWAKLKGHRYWPAQILGVVGKNGRSTTVNFFGGNSVGTVNSRWIRPYIQFREDFSYGKNLAKSFYVAVEEVKAMIAEHGEAYLAGPPTDDSSESAVEDLVDMERPSTSKGPSPTKMSRKSPPKEMPIVKEEPVKSEANPTTSSDPTIDVFDPSIPNNTLPIPRDPLNQKVEILKSRVKIKTEQTAPPEYEADEFLTNSISEKSLPKKMGEAFLAGLSAGDNSESAVDKLAGMKRPSTLKGPSPAKMSRKSPAKEMPIVKEKPVKSKANPKTSSDPTTDIFGPSIVNNTGPMPRNLLNEKVEILKSRAKIKIEQTDPPEFVADEFLTNSISEKSLPKKREGPPSPTKMSKKTLANEMAIVKVEPVTSEANPTTSSDPTIDVFGPTILNNTMPRNLLNPKELLKSRAKIKIEQADPPEFVADEFLNSISEKSLPKKREGPSPTKMSKKTLANEMAIVKVEPVKTKEIPSTSSDFTIDVFDPSMLNNTVPMPTNLINSKIEILKSRTKIKTEQTTPPEFVTEELLNMPNLISEKSPKKRGRKPAVVQHDPAVKMIKPAKIKMELQDSCNSVVDVQKPSTSKSDGPSPKKRGRKPSGKEKPTPAAKEKSSAKERPSVTGKKPVKIKIPPKASSELTVDELDLQMPSTSKGIKKEPVESPPLQKKWAPRSTRAIVDSTRESLRMPISTASTNTPAPRRRHNTKNACNKVYGFIGLGAMGKQLAHRLLKQNLKVVIWNRTSEKCQDLVSSGATTADCSGDVIHLADITFCCVADSAASQKIFFSHNGILQAIGPGKGYVEMSGVTLKDSKNIAHCISNRGGRYLELQMHGTIQDAEKGDVILIGSNDKSLFEDSKVAIRAMTNSFHFFDKVGSSIKLKLLLQGLRTGMLCAVTEMHSLALADDKELAENFTQMLKVPKWRSSLFPEKLHIANKMMKSISAGTKNTNKSKKGPGGHSEDSSTSVPIQQTTTSTFNDIHNLWSWGNSLYQGMPVTSASSLLLLTAKRHGFENQDEASVFRYFK